MSDDVNYVCDRQYIILILMSLITLIPWEIDDPEESQGHFLRCNLWLAKCFTKNWSTILLSQIF